MVLAARGTRETDTGTEPIADAQLVAALKIRARGVWVKAIVALVLTLGALVSLRHLWDL